MEEIERGMIERVGPPSKRRSFSRGLTLRVIAEGWERYPVLKFWGTLNWTEEILKLGNYTNFDIRRPINFKKLECGYPYRDNVPIAIQITEFIFNPFSKLCIKGEVFNNLSSYKNSGTAIKNFEINLASAGPP